MKKIIALALALIMVLSMGTVAFAAGSVVLPDGVDEASFGSNTVTDGTYYYATLQAAVQAIADAKTVDAKLYCKPDADVGSLDHAPVINTLTVYGNGAEVTGGNERDFDIGNTDPSGGRDITADMTLTVYDLDGCGAWGAKATEHTVNLVFVNCKNMGKVFLTGSTGTLNITMTDCAFEGVIKEAVYSNADGKIELVDVDFSNLNKAVNLNHKAAGTQNVILTDCTFTNCGNDVSADQIPVRVLSSVEGGSSSLTVTDCSFSGTPVGGADILLDNGVGTTDASVSGTAANVILVDAENVEEVIKVSENDLVSFTNYDLVATPGEEITVATNIDRTVYKVKSYDFTTGTKGYQGASYIDEVKIEKDGDVVIVLKSNYKLAVDKNIKGEVVLVKKADKNATLTIPVEYTVANNVAEIYGGRKASEATDLNNPKVFGDNCVIVMDEDGGYVSFSEEMLSGVVKMNKDEKTFLNLIYGNTLKTEDTIDAIEEYLGEDYVDEAIMEYYTFETRAFKNEVAFSYEAYEDDPHFFYLWNDGKLTKIDVQYNDDEDVEAWEWTAVAEGTIIVTDVEIVLAAEEETKNPDTGANDVVGIAAALAVTSLVAAAAVSIKK